MYTGFGRVIYVVQLFTSIKYILDTTLAEIQPKIEPKSKKKYIWNVIMKTSREFY